MGLSCLADLAEKHSRLKDQGRIYSTNDWILTPSCLSRSLASVGTPVALPPLPPAISLRSTNSKVSSAAVSWGCLGELTCHLAQFIPVFHSPFNPSLKPHVLDRLLTALLMLLPICSSIFRKVSLGVGDLTFVEAAIAHQCLKRAKPTWSNQNKLCV